jgi:hypothetical protein
LSVAARPNPQRQGDRRRSVVCHLAGNRIRSKLLKNLFDATGLVDQARNAAAAFDLTGRVELSDFAAKGNINKQTYLIEAGPQDNRTEG